MLITNSDTGMASRPNTCHGCSPASTGSPHHVRGLAAAIAARHRKDRKMLPLRLGIAIGVLVIFSGLPFLAPVFMTLGWERTGRIIYMIYSGLATRWLNAPSTFSAPVAFKCTTSPICRSIWLA